MTSIAGKQTHRNRRGLKALLSGIFTTALLTSAVQAYAASSVDWQQTLRELATRGQLDKALDIVEARLAASPQDAEAHGWRGRILAWKGRWPEAETEYRSVLQKAPGDIEIECALADVLLWQGKTDAALGVIEQGRAQAPANTEVLVRRARILAGLGLRQQARIQFREVLDLEPHNGAAKSGLQSLGGEKRHELRIGNDVDTFSYTDAAQTQSLILSSRWNQNWSSHVNTNIYQRFGTQAQRVAAGTAFRFHDGNWIGVEGAGANDHGITPKCEAALGVGHAFRWHAPSVRGAEFFYQQRWLWYSTAHVQLFSLTQLYYLPRNWTWGLTLTGARNGFAGTAVDWLPSGSTRLGFPIGPYLRRRSAPASNFQSGHRRFRSAAKSNTKAQPNQLRSELWHSFLNGCPAT